MGIGKLPGISDQTYRKETENADLMICSVDYS